MSFTSGGLAIGTAAVDSTGVATLTILLQNSAGSENIVASYAGDSVYAAIELCVDARFRQGSPRSSRSRSIRPESAS